MATGTTQSPPDTHLPPHYSWPTIKVLTVPQGGSVSTITPDEWCLTFCQQKVEGRLNSKAPDCRTVCLRKVWPHEVRNILNFRRHPRTDPEGNARYPLPPEGQPANLPLILGGRRPPPTADDVMDDEDEIGPGPVERQAPSGSPPEVPKKDWQEGWYFWTSNSTLGSLQHIDRMRSSLSAQQRKDEILNKRKEIWHEYQEYLERTAEPRIHVPGQNDKWFGHIAPPRPLPDTSEGATMFSMPPDLEISERVSKLLAPSYRSINLLEQSLKNGDFITFGGKMWQTAQTDIPYQLAERGWKEMVKIWDKFWGPDDDDPKKKK